MAVGYVIETALERKNIMLCSLLSTSEGSGAGKLACSPSFYPRYVHKVRGLLLIRIDNRTKI